MGPQVHGITIVVTGPGLRAPATKSESRTSGRRAAPGLRRGAMKSESRTAGRKAHASERSISRVLYVATILLGSPLPASSSNQPGVIVRATRPLSGLASGGVCRALVVTNEAVRSYRTISPL